MGWGGVWDWIGALVNPKNCPKPFNIKHAFSGQEVMGFKLTRTKKPIFAKEIFFFDQKRGLGTEKGWVPKNLRYFTV